MVWKAKWEILREKIENLEDSDEKNYILNLMSDLDTDDPSDTAEFYSATRTDNSNTVDGLYLRGKGKNRHQICSPEKNKSYPIDIETLTVIPDPREGWILCSERLPDTHRPVLITTDQLPAGVNGLIDKDNPRVKDMVYQAQYYKEVNDWRSIIRGDIMWFRTVRPYAWREFPSPCPRDLQST